MKGIGHSGDETNFMQQLQHDFMICCVIEIFYVNYTTSESLFACAVSGAFQLSLVNPGKRRKVSGVHASLGDIFCFFLLTDFY